MAKNFRAQGQNLTVLATATVASGSFQVVEGVFGVALTDVEVVCDSLSPLAHRLDRLERGLEQRVERALAEALR